MSHIVLIDHFTSLRLETTFLLFSTRQNGCALHFVVLDFGSSWVKVNWLESNPICRRAYRNRTRWWFHRVKGSCVVGSKKVHTVQCKAPALDHHASTYRPELATSPSRVRSTSCTARAYLLPSSSEDRSLSHWQDTRRLVNCPRWPLQCTPSDRRCVRRRSQTLLE